MSVWMEIRCENRAFTKVEFWKGGKEHRCWSSDNAGPMLNANETIKDVAATYRELENDAKRSGWRKIKKPIQTYEGDDISGWICPHCAEHELGLIKAKN